MFLIKSILNNIPRPLLIKLSYWVKPILTWFLRGKTFTDPIDGKSFKKLLPYGYNKQRKNALSPSTFSLERHRLLWLYLKNETDFFSLTNKLKVLHIAPEQCFLNLFKKQPNLEYISSDLLSPIADVKADICNLPFADSSFDVIFCNHVLEHIPNDTKAMQELFRVLKKGGFGIFQIPQDTNRQTTYEDSTITHPKQRSKAFGQYDHLRVYGLDYFDKLRSIGFDVHEVFYAKTLSPQMVKQYALDISEILPVCYKK
ncbi:MAG: class I SAM-dependent methyltransferase [Tenacibaculum sp.]